MKRLACVVCVSLLAFACGGDDGNGGPDAAAGAANPGFETPSETTTAWTQENDQWVEVGPADWSCLNTPSDLQPTENAVTVTGTVFDFQSGDPVSNAMMDVFPDVEFDSPFDTATADAEGNYSVEIPQGTERFGFKVSADEALDTYLLNQSVDSTATEATIPVDSVSESTATALPAFIGITRTPGLGTVAGAMRDRAGDEVANAIATVSATSGEPDHLEGAQTYYFSAGSSPLPVRHSAEPNTNTNGLFVVLELPVTAEAYLQVWGFTADQDPASDELTLLAEIPAPIVADSVVNASLEPLRQ